MVLMHKTLGYLSRVETSRVPKTFFGYVLAKKGVMTMTTSITSGQRKQYLRFVEDAAEKALEVVGLDKNGVQTLLRRGGELQGGIIDLLCKHSVSNQFANEEVESSYGYLSGYEKPVAVSDQIDILCAHWPNLNPDSALHYVSEVYPTLQFPSWVEGPFATIRPGFFSNVYGEEVKEVLEALAKARNGKFHNYREGKLGPKYLRQSERTLSHIRRLMEQQPDSDILISAAQFGIRHRGRSVRRAREVFPAGEYGKGVKNVGTMILTNPTRLQHYDDLWLDCPGDEYSPVADGVFGGAPYFCFSGGGVRFGTRDVADAFGDYGSVSAVLSQN